MFEKIVLAVDGSEWSEAAVDAAIGFAGKAGAEVEVVHVQEHDVIYSKGYAPDLETVEEAATLVTRTVDRLREKGVPAHGTVRKAPTRQVPQEIIDAATEIGADLIVVGSRGLTGFPSMLLGSVSNKLIHAAGRAVLVSHKRE